MWGWHGLTDIHQEARSASEDVHHGDHGAEEVAGHSVKHCCELFEVSRAAYYERKKDAPSAREGEDVPSSVELR